MLKFPAGFEVTGLGEIQETFLRIRYASPIRSPKIGFEVAGILDKRNELSMPTGIRDVSYTIYTILYAGRHDYWSEFFQIHGNALKVFRQGADEVTIQSETVSLSELHPVEIRRRGIIDHTKERGPNDSCLPDFAMLIQEDDVNLWFDNGIVTTHFVRCGCSQINENGPAEQLAASLRDYIQQRNQAA